MLLSAVELGVFRALAGGSLDLEALRGRVGLHPRGARDFFDTLVAMGLLEREDGRYPNAPDAAVFLDPTRPTYMGDGLPGAQLAAALTAALRNGGPVASERNDNRYRSRYVDRR